MNMLKTTLLPTLLIAGVGNAIASTELRWLNNAPARHFTEQDWDVLMENVQRVLDETPDGETVEWANEETGAHGSLTPASTGERNGMTCRSLEMENHARNVSATSNLEYCRDRMAAGDSSANRPAPGPDRHVAARPTWPLRRPGRRNNHPGRLAVLVEQRLLGPLVLRFVDRPRVVGLLQVCQFLAQRLGRYFGLGLTATPAAAQHQDDGGCRQQHRNPLHHFSPVWIRQPV